MLPPSIRRLALADVDQDVLRALAKHGESHLVERKVKPPERPRFGAAAAAFANTLGGWILLGVDDDGKPVGWEPPGRADLQSHLGQILRDEVDPLPPYVAAPLDLDGKPIAVMRVFESADTPHVQRGTGAIYVRTPKGKEPVAVDDHQTVLALARRGEDAENEARERLGKLPVIGHVFGTPDSGYDLPDFHGVHFVVRAAPVTVTPAFRDWPLTRRAADRCSAVLPTLLTTPPFDESTDQLDPYGRAVVATRICGGMSGGNDEAIAAADSGGVIAAGIRRGADEGDPASIIIERTLDDEIKPLVKVVCDLLVEAEAYGRVVMDLWVMFPSDAKLYGRRRAPLDLLHSATTLTVPADADEIDGVARAFHREIQRSVGIPKFEDQVG